MIATLQILRAIFRDLRIISKQKGRNATLHFLSKMIGEYCLEIKKEKPDLRDYYLWEKAAKSEIDRILNCKSPKVPDNS